MALVLPAPAPGGYMSNMAVNLTLPTLAATAALGSWIAARLRAGDAVLLEGPLGAGKSALARAILRALLADPALVVPSPTFTLVQSYDGPDFPVAHFDLWRLEDSSAVTELGWDEARQGAVLVEWPDRLGPYRPEHALCVTLAYAPADTRVAILDGPPRFLPPFPPGEDRGEGAHAA